MIFLGIDPGLTGAIALINHRSVSWIVDTPILVTDLKGKTEKGNKRHRTIYNASEMAKILSPFEVLADNGAEVQAFIEKSQPMPEQGVTSTFSTGYGFGLWIGILASLRIPYTQVHPVSWKKRLMMDMPKEKDSSIVRAKQLYPHADITLKKHHGRAEALLIAHYGLMQYGTA